ncbi:MAG: O-antigen ligase family protein [Chloroflexi bacterium]|nr:O-antigen ligase family protein [Chloroflexota bacterium]
MKRLADTLLSLELALTSLAVLLLMTEEPRLLPLALALIALPWPLRLWRHRRLTVRTPLDGPLLLFLLTAAVGLWAAYDRTLAWPKFWLIVGGVALYYALANQRISKPVLSEAEGSQSAIRNPQSAIGNIRHSSFVIRHWSLGLCLFAAVLGVYFVTQRDWVAEPAKFTAITRLGTWIAARTPRVPGPTINGNVLAGALALVWPINLALVLTSRKSQVTGRRSPEHVSRFTFHVLRFTLYVSRIISLFTLLLVTFALIMTGSRGAWLALGVAGALWLLRRLRQRWVRLADALAVTVIAAALGLLLWPGAAGRLSTAGLAGWLGSIPVGGTALNRFDLYRQALTLLRDYPFTGSGLGCFMMVYSTYVLLLHVGFITHAHNLFLQIAVEQGVFGLLAFIWLIVAFFWLQVASRKSQICKSANQQISKSANHKSANHKSAIRNPQSAIRNAATWAVVVILVHGLVDATLYASRTLPFLFVPFGLAAANQQIGKSANHKSEVRIPQSAIRIPQSAVRVLLAVGLLAGALIWRRPLLGLVFSNLGAVHQTRTELAVYQWPKYPLQDAVRHQHRDTLTPAVAEFSRALVWDATNVTANQRLGQLQLAWGDYAAALTHLQAASEGINPQSAFRIPQSPALRQLLGEALIVNGQLEAGRALWSTVENGQGQLSLRAWWYTYIEDEERAEGVRWASETR